MRKNLKRTVASWLRRGQKKKMVEEGGAPASFYDEAYSGSVDEYTVHYSQSRYLPVWEAISSRIDPGASLLEVGCGPGQLANMLLDQRVAGEYVGFDFSEKAIGLAAKNLPGHRVEVADARTTDLFDTVTYDTVVCTEVLEHIVDDLDVLGRIPSGKHVLATVPDFDYLSHVRFFKDRAQVEDRYAYLFSKLEISLHHHSGDAGGHHGTFFLLDGVRA